ncbi:hypothetical protein [Chitinolyticbacter meiyuanensis]|uniref:hypothetical protein n=1 Tax=Chitinolyticbacter meiyuanensis TaxID=682798 RepID=UPI0011E5D651|nr:hypothetical protein [Chitinolyticbacter meiyuanensis]
MSDSALMHKELFWLMCKEKLGQGIGRMAFSTDVLPNSVIKVEEGAGSFQNIVEWETWKRVEHTEYAKWFAPCEWISPSGSVLIMRRTKQVRSYPKEMPVFLADFKRANYGMIGRQIVCHDYGTNMLFERGMSKRMQKVEWWDL